MRYLLLVITILFVYSCTSQVKTQNGASIYHKDMTTDIKLGRNKLQYPKTIEKIVEYNYFGTIVKDPYQWLENDNEQNVKSWVKAQNDFTKSYLNGGLKKKIADKYRKLFNYTKYSSVMKKGEYYFYYKNDGLQPQSVFYKTKDIKKEGDVVIDPNKLSKDGTSSLGGIYLNKNATIMVYGVSQGGADNQTYYIKNIKTNKLYNEKLLNMRYSSIAWNKDDGFYYGRYPNPKNVKKENATLNHKLYYHKLGTPQSEDKLIYEEPKFPKHAFAPQITEDNRFLIIYVWQGTDPNTMIYYKDLTKKDSKIVKLFSEFDASYEVIGNIEDDFYILTNKNAPKKRVVKLNILNKDKKLVEIIKENKNKTLESAFISNNSIFTNYMKDVHNEVSIFDLNGKFLKDINLPAIGTASIRGKQSNNKVFVTFTSFLYPGVIYDYNFKADKLTELFKTKLDFNKNDFEAKQIFYKSKDGTRIPMFIVHKKGIKLDGTNPTILYGYGGFNISLTPWFSTIRLLWMRNGGIFAIANLRGGGEYGEEWHRAGMLDKKQNVFDDFIYGAKYLIKNKYTNSKKLAIMGGSNGGLLVSAVMVQKPKLFGAVICQVPLTDMLRYHKFLVGHYWIPEYGDAEHSKKEFDYLYKYSPYHNVKDAYYPATMVATADSDDRVAPLHSRKFIAMLQKHNKSYNPILLRVESKSGHGHGMSTEQIIDEQSDIYTFLFTIFGMTFK